MNKLALESKENFNVLFGNMFKFDDEDMAYYSPCYESVFKDGVTISYMSSTFFAQFSAEILFGMIASNPFRKFLIHALDEEKVITAKRDYWNESMNELRFGIAGKDYTNDTAELMAMMNTSYNKISSLNQWFGTDEGMKKFDMYCLSRKALKDMKRIICEYPYLIRKYDYDQEFANEIMEYAGIVAVQLEESMK